MQCIAYSYYKVKPMLIGELSAATDCPVETIRYFEHIGLLRPAGRLPNGYRDYSDEHLKWLQFILRSRALGFSQAETRRLTDLAQQAEQDCASVHTLLSTHERDVSHKIRELQQLRASLRRMMDRCQQGELQECPVIDELIS